MTSDPTKPRRRDLIRWPHLLLRGIWELGRARIGLGAVGPRDVERLNRSAPEEAAKSGPSTDPANAMARTGFIITFAARYLPWRSDCLPQALAARRWLLDQGIATEIRIGVERPEDGEFGAHAWLVRGDRVITGGEIGNFAVLLGEGAAKSAD